MFRTTHRAIAYALSGCCLAALATFSTPASAQSQFLGAIDFVGFNFPPRGWSQCDGQILSINLNQALFSLLGTTFGGDGRTTFALPDLRGRSPIHDGGSAGSGLTRRDLGTKAGQQAVTLTVAQIPSHTHTLRGSNAAGNQTLPTGNTLANDAPDETYVDQAPNTSMNAAALGPTQSQSHENMSPFLAINCIIALEGVFPSRN